MMHTPSKQKPHPYKIKHSYPVLYGLNAGMSIFELLVALLLASLVVLMATGMYQQVLHKQRQAQHTATQIDAAYMAMNAIENIRLAGLGQTPSGGVLLAERQMNHITHAGAAVQSSLLSTQGLGLSLVDTASDQLTIRYTAPMTMWDCEGALVLGPRQVRLNDGKLIMVDGQVVIERYFIQKESDGSLSLRCDAGRYIVDPIARDGMRNERASLYHTAIIDQEVARDAVSQPFVLRGFGLAGEIIMQQVGGFWVQLLVKRGDGVQPMSIADYQHAYALKQVQAMDIVGVSLAVLSLGLGLAESSIGAAPAELVGFGGILSWQNEVTPPKGARILRMDVSLRNALYRDMSADEPNYADALP